MEDERFISVSIVTFLGENVKFTLKQVHFKNRTVVQSDTLLFSLPRRFAGLWACTTELDEK
jgi:hypothetical protein